MSAAMLQEARARLKGPVVPLTTPINDDGAVDYDGLARLTEFYVEGGIRAFIAAGTTGYCYALCEDEHERVVGTVIQASAGRAFVIAGVSHSGTWLANRLADRCEKAGADALLMIPPYYHQTSTYHGCLRHYEEVARGRGVGLIVYNTAAANLDVDFFKRCAEVETIIGIKEASGNYPLARDLLMQLGERMVVVGGGSMAYYLWHWMWGAPAYVTSIANLVPGVELEFYRHLEAGDLESARAVVVNLERPFFDIMTGTYSWHESLHAALKVFGLPAHRLRLPLVEPPADHQEAMRQGFIRLGLL